MSIRDNLLKSVLGRGDLALGLGVRQMQTIEIGMIAKAAGFDFIFIDCEHSTMGMARAGEICTASLGQGVAPIVRVSDQEAHHVVPLLDSGVQGIVVPHVETAQEARAIVDTLRFPPLGHRSMSRSCAMTEYETMSIPEIIRIANSECLCIPMLESRAAVDNASAIAQVEGVDVLLIGASDLCADLGLPGAFDHPQVVSACETIIDACKAAGRFCGISGVRSPSLIEHYIKCGVQMIHAGTDVPLLIEVGKQTTTALRAIARNSAAKP